MAACAGSRVPHAVAPLGRPHQRDDGSPVRKVRSERKHVDANSHVTPGHSRPGVTLFLCWFRFAAGKSVQIVWRATGAVVVRSPVFVYEEPALCRERTLRGFGEQGVQGDRRSGPGLTVFAITENPLPILDRAQQVTFL